MEVAIGIVITLLIALLGALLYHISQCAAFHERVAKMESEVTAIKKEIGDHESGIRGSLHKLRGEISPLLIEYDRRQDR
jgi:hypothetical protein